MDDTALTLDLRFIRNYLGLPAKPKKARLTREGWDPTTKLAMLIDEDEEMQRSYLESWGWPSLLKLLGPLAT